jgi:hypothetical protein
VRSGATPEHLLAASRLLCLNSQVFSVQ